MHHLHNSIRHIQGHGVIKFSDIIYCVCLSAGDSCCNDYGAGGFKLFIEQLLPGIYVKSLQTGSTPQEVGGYYNNDKNYVHLHVCMCFLGFFQ